MLTGERLVHALYYYVVPMHLVPGPAFYCNAR